MNSLLKISIVIAILSAIIVIKFPNISKYNLNLINKIIKNFNTFSSKVQNREQKTNCLSSGEKLFTREELSRYDGTSNSLGLYLGFLGIVYDVSKGAQHYRPGQSYSFFTGKDATRAFITGEFTETGLVDQLTDLDIESFDGLKTWIDLYTTEYRRVGKLIGTYYDSNGCPTQALHWVHKQMEENNRLKEEQNMESNVFPYCNSEWSQDSKSGRVWCSSMSGGIQRDWVGVPRQLFMPDKKQYRCACVRNTGTQTIPAIVYDDYDNTVDTNSEDVGDLNNPRLKQYEGCPPDSFECKIKD